MRKLSTWLQASQVVDLLAILVVLVAMVVANVEWLFTRPDWVDTWMYYGFFQHYNISDYLAGNKKIARLPWILVGFAVNRLFTPEMAALVLHIGCLALGVIAFYLLSRQMFGRKTAVLSSLIYLTWVPLHGFGGWDYHNTFVPVLYLASYRLLISATNREHVPWRNFVLFGVMLALSVHTNIMVLLLMPALLIRGAHGVQTWLTKESRLTVWLLHACVKVALGAVGITALLGLINVAFGRIFLFSEILVARSAFLIQHPELNQSEWQPWSNLWWIEDIHTPLFDSVLVLIVICALLSVRKWGLRKLLASSIFCAWAEYLVCLLIFAVGQTLGQEMLQPFYMGMPLALPMFLALAALIKRTITGPDGFETPSARTNGETGLVLFATLAVGVQFVWHLSIDLSWFDWRPEAWFNLPPMLIIILGFAAAEVVRRTLLPGPSNDRRRLAVRTIATYGVLAVALGQANTMWPRQPTDWVSYRLHSTCVVNQALLAAVGAADNILFPLARAGKQTLLWYQGDEFTGPSRGCRLAMYQLGRPLFAMGYGEFVHYWDVESAAAVPSNVLAQLTPGRDVAVLISNKSNYVSKVLESMRRVNASWHEVALDTISDRGFTFGFHLLTGAPPPRQALKFRLLPENGATLETDGFANQAIRLPRTPWTYAAILESGRPATNAGTIVVTAQVTSGTAALGVLNRDRSAFLARELIPKGPKPIDVYLRVPNWRGAGPLVLETAAGTGGGRAIVSSVASTQ